MKPTQYQSPEWRAHSTASLRGMAMWFPAVCRVDERHDTCPLVRRLTLGGQLTRMELLQVRRLFRDHFEHRGILFGQVGWCPH